MLVVNWQVTDRSGEDIVQWVRQHLAPELPVLFLTGGTHEDDIIAARNAGADDYIVKPVRRGELMTRVRALLRRAYPDRGTEVHIRIGKYVFEAESGRLWKAGQMVDVTRKEFELALLFFRNLGRPLSRAYILEMVWSPEADVPSRTLDTHVSRVRNKLDLRPENGYRLVPVYSFGYRLEELARPAGTSESVVLP
jgi:DNA-binding response OmpR family regulator